MLRYRRRDGDLALLEFRDLRDAIEDACEGLGHAVDSALVFADTVATIYDGVPEHEVEQALTLAARARIECEPAYAYVASRLLLRSLYREVLGATASFADAAVTYKACFPAYLQNCVAVGLLDPSLLSFDVERIAGALRAERDRLFTYSGLQTLADRYLLHHDGKHVELPQWLWMRVAMGLALNEANRDERAIEFYDVLSQFLFTTATPTLFNAGTRHPQLSSCYLTTIADDLGHIFKCIRDNALLSKWAGGLGNDWTNVRGLGAAIEGTNGKSQGVIPFLKVANDTAVAVNQGGKRKGAACAYLENWHLDVEEFLDLRRNTGDERRRTHDMNTALWVSDLFMKRVQASGQWTLFSPSDVPDLHDLYGRAFERCYEEYERRADAGEIRLYKRLSAVELWRKMLTRLFETGHPWICWKDCANVRSPQDHAGVIHSSNLCTEILLNTSFDETAVCNLGSINLPAHLVDGHLDLPRLERTIRTAIRMLDNVIDINYYPTPEAQNANLKHRPIGLGLMGFQDALQLLGISYASPEAVEFADRSMEAIAYNAILASAELARERGPYPSYPGSKWDRGLLPLDTIALLETERGEAVLVDRSTTLDWEPVRNAVRRYGMRNSNVLAIAPTATISTIAGVSPSIEPTYSNLYAKSNLSGEFISLNTYLVADLKRLGLWDDAMREALKYFDGSLQSIERVPDDIKRRYCTAFEIDPTWLIECASRRQKWIDMGQSLNLYLAEPSGKRLHEIYTMAWKRGLKTTYYLRTVAATQVEKSTLDVNRWGIQPRWMKNRSPSSAIQITRDALSDTTASAACDRDGECDVCQ